MTTIREKLSHEIGEYYGVIKEDKELRNFLLKLIALTAALPIVVAGAVSVPLYLQVRRENQNYIRRYSELYQQVLKLADKDGDGLEFQEQKEAWKRMGYDVTGSFTVPTLSALERAIESYKTK